MLKSIINNLSLLIILIPIMINFSMIIMFMNPMKYKFHPITLMIILILMTLLISFLMNLIFYSLMSFILFLAMIGGLIIIFLYITSLTNNNFFFFNFNLIIKNMIKILPLMTIMLLIMYFYMPINYMTNLNSQDLWKINLFQYNYDQININNLYNMINNKSSMFIMFYIYYSMICIMNICYKLKLPLRQLMY